jgi:hypothetical protein
MSARVDRIGAAMEVGPSGASGSVEASTAMRVATVA